MYLRSLSYHRRAVMLALLISILLIVSTVAYGSEYEALQGKLIVGRCHMETCWWFSIENARKMGETKIGELFAISTKSWSAQCKESDENRCGHRKFDGADISFFLCSRTHPAWISNDNNDNKPNEWTVHRLGPGTMDASSGAGWGIHVMYWAACHQLEVIDPFDTNLGDKFGYPTTLSHFLDESENGKRVANPFDLLDPPGRKPQKK